MPVLLPDELQAELNLAWRIRLRVDLPELIGRHAGVRAAEANRVERIEPLGAELELELFAQCEILEQRQIPVTYAGRTQVGRTRLRIPECKGRGLREHTGVEVFEQTVVDIAAQLAAGAVIVGEAAGIKQASHIVAGNRQRRSGLIRGESIELPAAGDRVGHRMPVGT